MIRRLWTTLCTGLLASALTAPLQAQSTWFVPEDSATIQGAINGAEPGDTVLVAAGTYHESIDFLGKDIVVRSIDGPEATAIDVTDLESSAVRFENGESRSAQLRGFTLKGGTGTVRGLQRKGGAILIDVADPTIVNCVLNGNEAETGGGAWMHLSYGIFDHCRFVDNTSGTNGQGGGGAYVSMGAPEFLNCTFEANQSGYVGGGMAATLSYASLRGCIFIDNSASFGGGYETIGSYGEVVNCTFHGNTASLGDPSFGGGMRATYGSDVVVRNTIFWNNPPADLRVNSSELLLVHSMTETTWEGPGSGNIVGDPYFREDGVRLLPASPCIDRVAVEDAAEADADGTARNEDGDEDGDPTADIGAFEYIANSILVGACCYADGSCVENTDAGCAIAGGTYAGDGVDCDSQQCAPMGACCVDGNCTIATELDCTAMAGEYLGDQAACEEGACAPPTVLAACCLPDDFCLVTTAEQCGVIGGEFLTDQPDCSAGCVPAPPTGSCCVNESCSEMTLDECVGLGGSYGGDGSTCVTAPCPCPGDANGDTAVDFDDLVAVLNDWGDCPGCPADFDASGAVDFNDLLAVLEGWGSCP